MNPISVDAMESPLANGLRKDGGEKAKWGTPCFRESYSEIVETIKTRGGGQEGLEGSSDAGCILKGGLIGFVESL